MNNEPDWSDPDTHGVTPAPKWLASVMVGLGLVTLTACTIWLAWIIEHIGE